MCKAKRDAAHPLSQELTVDQAIKTLADALRAAGLETPLRDAQLLVQDAVGLSREVCLSNPKTMLNSAQCATLDAHQTRRLAREPVARILGYRHFYGRRFAISPATLDPRADTETVIDCVLAYVKENDLGDAPLRILDVGTGSGILLLTLLSELPRATGLGTDISGDALAIAEKNATVVGVVPRVQFRHEDGVENLSGPFDIMVSNPPYIATSVIGELEPDVRDFDPRIALDGGADGLTFYRRLAPHVARLVPSGLTALEVGHDQSDAVLELLKEHANGHGHVQFLVKKDLAGHRRCVALQTHC